jgi:hypothetical protein
MELPLLTVNYHTLTNDNYTTLHYTALNQRYEYKQCYHPTEREIKKKKNFLTYPRKLCLQFSTSQNFCCRAYGDECASYKNYK